MNLQRILLSVLVVASLYSCNKMTLEKRMQMVDSISEFRNDKALCKVGEDYYFVDREGNRLGFNGDTTMILYNMEEFANGYAIAKMTSNSGSSTAFINENFDVKYYPVYDYSYPVTESGRTWVSTNAGWSVIDIESGSFMCEPYNIQEIVDGIGVAKRKAHPDGYYEDISEWAIINNEGEMIVPFGTYSYIALPSNGRIVFSPNGYISALNSGPMYKHGRGCRDGLQPTPGNRHPVLYGYLDYEGNVAIPPIYVKVDAFDKDGVANAFKTTSDYYAYEFAERNKMFNPNTKLPNFKIDKDGNRVK